MARFYMNNKYKAGEGLDVLCIDKDSDKEDFAESELTLQETEQESDRENDEQELEDELSFFPQNEDLLGSAARR